MEKFTGEEVEEKEEEKKLYLFLDHHNFGDACIHSFYEIPIPKPPSDPHLPPPEEAKRVELSPILCFSYEEHGRNMYCANLGSKFYFIGGISRDPKTGYDLHRKEVYVLDVAEAKPSLKKGPPMNTPKVGAFAFAVHGKIYVLSGKRRIIDGNVSLHPFEMFNPSESLWEKLPLPPFREYVAGHVVVNHRVFVYCNGVPSTIYIFDLISKVWDQTVAPPNFDFGFGSLVLGNKLYSCPFTRMVVSNTLDLSVLDNEDKKKKKKAPLCLRSSSLEVVNSFKSWFPSTYVASAGNGQFCFLQVGCAPCPDDEDDMDWYHPSECLVNLTLFDSATDEVLSSAGFILQSFHAPTTVVAAIAELNLTTDETLSSCESNVDAKDTQPSPSGRQLAAPTTGSFTEDEIRAVLLAKKTGTTTISDLVSVFSSRLRSKEDKKAFANILWRISIVVKTKEESNYVALRGGGDKIRPATMTDDFDLCNDVLRPVPYAAEHPKIEFAERTLKKLFFQQTFSHIPGESINEKKLFLSVFLFCISLLTIIIIS